MGFIQEARDRAPKAAALGLAFSMLGSPAVAQGPKSEPGTFAETSFSVELDSRYKLPLSVLRDMVDISSPDVEEIFKAVSKNPEEHIEIVDGFGYGDQYYIPDGFTYYIYPDKQIAGEIDPMWSAAVIVESINGEPGLATVFLQMNVGLEVYKGREDFMPNFPIPEQMLEYASENLFNEPPSLSEKPWEIVPNLELPMYSRKHTEGNGDFFEQTVSASNLIIFTSPYPIPENVAEKSQDIVVSEPEQ